MVAINLTNDLTETLKERQAPPVPQALPRLRHEQGLQCLFRFHVDVDRLVVTGERVAGHIISLVFHLVVGGK